MKRWWWRAQSFEKFDAKKHPQGTPIAAQIEGVGEFDEVVIGQPCWLHLERMDAWNCYLGIGERKWMIHIDTKGEPHMGEEYS